MFQQPDWVIPIFQPLMRINGGGLPDPYGHLIRIFDFADAITRILVQGVPGSYKNAMVDIQRELSDFYANLPTELRFQASTLQAYASIYHGEAFVLLHVSSSFLFSYRALADASGLVPCASLFSSRKL